MGDTPVIPDSRSKKYINRKSWLWLFWLTVTVVSSVYMNLSFLSFHKIRRVQKHPGNGIHDNILWSVLVSTFMGPFVVTAVLAFGALILFWRMMTGTKAGIPYCVDALQVSVMWAAVVVLMSAVSLNGHKDVMQDIWQPKRRRIPKDLPWHSGETALVQATYIAAYVLSLVFFLLFFVMFVYRDAAKELLLDDDGHASVSQPLERPTNESRVAGLPPIDEATTLHVTVNNTGSVAAGEQPPRSGQEQRTLPPMRRPQVDAALRRYEQHCNKSGAGRQHKRTGVRE